MFMPSTATTKSYLTSFLKAGPNSGQIFRQKNGFKNPSPWHMPVFAYNPSNGLPYKYFAFLTACQFLPWPLMLDHISLH